MEDGDAFPKIYGGDGYITILPIQMVNWTANRPPTQSNRARLQ